MILNFSQKTAHSHILIKKGKFIATFQILKLTKMEKFIKLEYMKLKVIIILIKSQAK